MLTHFVFLLQAFLADYGMIWVGEPSDSDSDVDDLLESAVPSLEKGGSWSPGEQATI